MRAGFGQAMDLLVEFVDQCERFLVDPVGVFERVIEPVKHFFQIVIAHAVSPCLSLPNLSLVAIDLVAVCVDLNRVLGAVSGMASETGQTG
jgi:hypothetical protein